MANPSATIHVTKLAAANRQLRAAVRIFFLGEDELAVHTVAAAAYGLLTGLKTDRGRDEVGDFYLNEIFYAVRDFRSGTLPSYFTNDPEAMEWVRELAEKLPIGVDSKFPDFLASVSPAVAKAYWQKRNAAPNFLKHADRDPHAHISLDEVDNLQLLMQAYCAYVDLVHDDLAAEGLVLWLYYAVTNGLVEELPAQWKTIAAKMESLGHNERIRFCSMCICELNAPV